MMHYNTAINTKGHFMAFSKEKRKGTISGIVFVALVAAAATYIAELAPIAKLGISPLVVGIVIGIFYANTLHNKFPALSSPVKRSCVLRLSFTVFVSLSSRSLR
jgi:uncharacterized membrane protein YadS